MGRVCCRRARKARGGSSAGRRRRRKLRSKAQTKCTRRWACGNAGREESNEQVSTHALGAWPGDAFGHAAHERRWGARMETGLTLPYFCAASNTAAVDFGSSESILSRAGGRCVVGGSEKDVARARRRHLHPTATFDSAQVRPLRLAATTTARAAELGRHADRQALPARVPTR